MTRRSMARLLALLASFAGAVVLLQTCAMPKSDRRASSHLVLVGASIGRAWRLEEWPARVHEPGVTAESLAVWQFDKSPAVEDLVRRPHREFRLSPAYFKSLLMAPPRQPDVVILKECSSYFPGDVNAYMHGIRDWTERLRGRRIAVVLATVAPVTESRAGRDPGKQQSLLEFNRAIRSYAQQQGIPLLDLEAALRTDSAGAYLRDEYTSGDGSHLNAAAYAVLDRVLLTAMRGLRQPQDKMAAGVSRRP